MTKRRFIIVCFVIFAAGISTYFGLRKVNKLPQSRSAACDAVEKELTSLLTGSNVLYSKGCFVPQKLTIKAGTSVIFTDYGDDPMWVESDPAHGGIRNFNSGQAWNKGQSYGYSFADTGTYTYFNHMKSNDKGTVVVEK